MDSHEPAPLESSGAAPEPAGPDRSQRFIFLFWLPLAAQWMMMAAEGPFLAAIIARLGDPTFNLAAYGVAFAFAILVESPVIMLMSASTALVDDAVSYRRLRNFTRALNAGSTGLLVLVLIPPVFDTIMRSALGLPDPVADLVYGALWLLLPWPAAIGYRRFLHGLLIRAGRTRLVAYGTVLRLAAMGSTAAALYALTDMPGAWVGAAALSAGVCMEAVAAGIMAAPVVRRLRADVPGSRPGADEAPSYREIGRFYLPLALTSLIGLTVHPLLTFFMGRAPSPVESLAVFPVVHALSFLFRAPGFSYQEAAIALLGRRCEHIEPLVRFAVVLALLSSAGLALVAFTPAATVWFETISGLPPELARMAIVPTRILVPLPALSVLLALQSAVLVQGRRTRPITIASGLEVVVIAGLFAILGWWLGLIGVTAAMLAFLVGRLVGILYLGRPVNEVLAR
jgi:progressive ankylosis protein